MSDLESRCEEEIGEMGDEQITRRKIAAWGDCRDRFHVHG